MALIIAIIVAVVAFRAWINDVKADAFRNGEAASELRHQKALDQANARNRERERQLQNDLNDFGKRFEALATERHEREQTIVNRIEERIVAQENCEIDPEIIRMRNEIRGMK